MNTVICTECRQPLSSSSHTKAIRCHGCGRIISVGSSQESVNKDQDNITTERKWLREFYEKISGSSRSSPSFSQFPTARISDAPPRGKRALLCGVSYKSRKFKLRGTTQDVVNMIKLLVQQFSFPTNAILVLADVVLCYYFQLMHPTRSRQLADYMTYESPTRNNILLAFDWLMKDLHSEDSLVFYFSGHGKRQINLERDEIDGFDEAICPLDFETAGLIIDNEINTRLVRPLEKGVKLHAIIDACHSGTVLDLPHVYDNNKGSWKDNYPPSEANKGTSGGQAICFSACEDYQQASDTSAFSSEMAGAMTFTFIKAVKEKQEITYRGILNSMHNAIEEANNSQRGCGILNRVFYRKMLQDPILSSSQVFNVNSVFKL